MRTAWVCSFHQEIQLPTDGRHSAFQQLRGDFNPSLLGYISPSKSRDLDSAEEGKTTAELDQRASLGSQKVLPAKADHLAFSPALLVDPRRLSRA